MPGLRPFIALGYYRTSPLAVGIRALPRGTVSACVRGIRAGCARPAVHAATTNRSSSPFRPWGVPSRARNTSIWPVRSARNSVRAIVRVVVSANSVSDGVRAIDRIRIVSVIVIRRVVVAAAVSQRGSDRDPDDEHSHITCRAARFGFSARRRCLRHVSDVVDRRTRRDGVNFLGHGVRSLPRSRRRNGHEPHALETQVVQISDLDDFVLRIRSVREGSGLNRFELWIAIVGDRDLRLCFSLIHDHGIWYLRNQYRIRGFVRSRNGNQDAGTRTVRRNLGKVRGQVGSSKSPRSFEALGAKPPASYQVVVLILGVL